METVKPTFKKTYLALGLAGLSLAYTIGSTVDFLKLAEDKNALHYYDEIIRYRDINRELNFSTNLKYEDLFDEEKRNYFSELIAKRDSLKSLEGFDEARKEYWSQVELLGGKLMVGPMAGVLGFNISIGWLLNLRMNRKKDQNIESTLNRGVKK